MVRIQIATAAAIIVAAQVSWAQDAASQAPIFDINHPNESVSIVNLDCKLFGALVQKKDPAVGEVLIWLHGVVSGIDKKTTVFNKNFIGGVLYAVELGCMSHNDRTLMDAFLEGEAQMVESAKKNSARN